MTIGTLTAGIASAILTVPYPTDQDTGTEGAGGPSEDFGFLAVWSSTSSGFTPGSGNLAGYVRGTTFTLSNLTPLTLIYVRWAYIPEGLLASAIADPSGVLQTEELSTTPNKIDGTLLADEFRGKRIVSGSVMSAGTVSAETKNVPSGSDVTLNVNDASDFYSDGGVMVIFPSDRDGVNAFRYTGKSGNQLTGVSGYGGDVKSGEVLLSVPYAVDWVRSYPGSGSLSLSGRYINQITGQFFRRSGTSSAFFISKDTNTVDAFTYTGTSSTQLTGISGLAAITAQADGSYAGAVIDVTGLPVTASLSSAVTYTSLTLTGSMSKFNTTGGEVLLLKDGAAVMTLSYTTLSGNTITLSANTPILSGTGVSGIYTAVPVYSLFASAKNSSLFSASTTGGFNLINSLGVFFANGLFDVLSCYAGSTEGAFTVGGALTTAGNATIGGNIATTGDGTKSLQLGDGRTDSNYALIDLVGDTTYSDYGLRIVRGNTGANAVSQINHRGTGELSVTTQDAAPIALKTNGTTRAYLTSAGDVGIGTTSPESKLHVSGSQTVTGSINNSPTVSAPATGATTTVSVEVSNYYLNHAATIAAHTVALPTSGLRDGHEVTVAARSAVTTLTVTGTVGGNAPRGAPATLAAGGFFTMRYSSSASAWYRCG